jgi:3-oxoacyl-[acyl-carrier protein] reductase
MGCLPISTSTEPKKGIMTKLSNKVALVTGASKGIGASIAKHLALAGATVFVNYASSKVDAENVVAEILAARGKAVAIQGDFTNPDDIERVFAEIARTEKHLDILVNNAGVYSFGPVEATTVEEFHRLFNLNVLGLVLSVKGASPLFPSEGGTIINIGAMVGKMSTAYSSLLSGTKGAVDSISLSLSKELGPRNIRVNALNPGLVQTEGTDSGGYIAGDFGKFILSTTPLGRIGKPDDVANIAVFLASDDSAWVTGQVIGATGGQTM